MEVSPADALDHFATNTVDLERLLSLVDPTLAALDQHDRWVGQHGYESLSSAESLVDSVHSSASALWNHLEILWKQYEASEWVQSGIFGVLKSLGEATQRTLAQIPRDPDLAPTGPLAIRLSERMTPVCFGDLTLAQFKAARNRLEKWIAESANSANPDVLDKTTLGEVDDGSSLAQPATPPPASDPANGAGSATDTGRKRQAVNPKRCTVPGEAQKKLISALTEHHRYANGGCDNWEPIGNNRLAHLADVSTSTAKVFLDKQFNGLKAYQRACADETALIASLKLLNDEYAPRDFLVPKKIVDPQAGTDDDES